MSTIYTQGSLTIVSAALGGSQVQVPGGNINLTANQTRALGTAIGLVISTHSLASPIQTVAGIDVFFSDGVIADNAPDGTTVYATGILIDATAVPYTQPLTLDQAVACSHAILSYTVV